MSKDLMKIFRQTGKTNLTTAMMQWKLRKIDDRKDLISPNTFEDDINYFLNKPWVSLPIPTEYLTLDIVIQPVTPIEYIFRYEESNEDRYDRAMKVI